MDNKPEIKKVNFYDDEFLTPQGEQSFKDAVSSAMVSSNARKNDYSEKLKTFLTEKSGGQKAFLFPSAEEGFIKLIKALRDNSQPGKSEIIILSKILFDNLKADFYADDNAVKYIFANHLGNFIASLSSKTCAVITELTDEYGREVYDAAFICQIAEICAVRDVAFVIDERGTFPSATGKVFAFSHYKIIPDAVIIGGTVNRCFQIGAVITFKKTKMPVGKKEVGFIPCAGALAAYEYCEKLAQTVKARGKKLCDTLNLCKRVKSAVAFGKYAVAEVQDGKKCAAELKEKGVKTGVSDNKLLFSVAPYLTEGEFEFGLSVISDVLKGAQNPFDMAKTY